MIRQSKRSYQSAWKVVTPGMDPERTAVHSQGRLPPLGSWLREVDLKPALAGGTFIRQILWGNHVLPVPCR